MRWMSCIYSPTPTEQFGGYYPRTRAPLLTLQLFVKAANAFLVAHALKAEGDMPGRLTLTDTILFFFLVVLRR